MSSELDEKKQREKEILNQQATLVDDSLELQAQRDGMSPSDSAHRESFTNAKSLSIATTAEEAVIEKSSRKKRLIWTTVGSVLLLAAIGGLLYWLHARQFESTDDAFIEGHTIQISPKVPGYVKEVYVTDNQQVKPGDLLVEIEPSDFQVKLDQARAALRAAYARHKTAQTGVALTRATSRAGIQQASSGVMAAQSGVIQARAAADSMHGRVAQARAAVSTAEAAADQTQAQAVAAKAEAVRARADVVRYQELFSKDEVSHQQLDRAVAAAQTADAQLEAARKRVSAAEAQIAEASAAYSAAEDQHRQSLSQISGAQAQVGQSAGKLSEANSAPEQLAVKESDVETASTEIERAEAAVKQAELDLSYTRIYAQEAGRVTKKSVEEGAYLQPGQALLAIVPAEMWVLANFKETQLDHMRVGQRVDIKVDAYSDKHFKGHVDSFQTGTGARFSLLPAENATGNYVKVVQRIPVKIVFDEQPDSVHLLAPGMSVEPEVKVK
jgi:membrane fusion protein (multidrug efflux system)